jgi:peptidylprolyl isomerase
MHKILTVLLISLIAVSFSSAQDTVTTSSGLKYIIFEQGAGTHAVSGKTVEVHYTGMLTNGKVFDSSRERGEPIEFLLGSAQVIKGWDEGIALMSVGDKFRLIIPPALGYGSKGIKDVIPPNSTLVFDVELMSVNEPKLSVTDTMMTVLFESNIEDAVAVYKDLKANAPDKYNFKESQLNTLGYQLLQIGRTKDAIEIFKLNIKQFPNSFNVYDSMGEAYMIDKNKELAVKNYEKSLELNPKNKNAEEMIKKLNEK